MGRRRKIFAHCVNAGTLSLGIRPVGVAVKSSLFISEDSQFMSEDAMGFGRYFEIDQ